MIELGSERPGEPVDLELEVADGPHQGCRERFTVAKGEPFFWHLMEEGSNQWHAYAPAGMHATVTDRLMMRHVLGPLAAPESAVLPRWRAWLGKVPVGDWTTDFPTAAEHCLRVRHNFGGPSSVEYRKADDHGWLSDKQIEQLINTKL